MRISFEQSPQVNLFPTIAKTPIRQEPLPTLNWPLTINLVTLLIFIISAVLAFWQALLVVKQIRFNYDWNRRKSAHDVLSNIILGDFMRIRRQLEDDIKIHPYELEKNYISEKHLFVEKDGNGKEVRNQTYLLRDFLNYLEQVCIAIKHGIIDDDIAFDSIQGLIMAYWRWSEPYVKESREKYKAELIWIEIEGRVKEWEERIEKAKAEAEVEREKGEARARAKRQVPPHAWE